MPKTSPQRRPNQLERCLIQYERRRSAPPPPRNANPINPTEIQQNNLNVSRYCNSGLGKGGAPGGCFYEKAKSRNNRHKEVYRSTALGQAVVREAVPLGRSLKRQSSLDSQKSKPLGRCLKRKLSLDSQISNSCVDKSSTKSNGHHFHSSAALAKLREGKEAMRKRSKLAETSGPSNNSLSVNTTSGLSKEMELGS